MWIFNQTHIVRDINEEVHVPQRNCAAILDVCGQIDDTSRLREIASDSLLHDALNDRNIFDDMAENAGNI